MVPILVIYYSLYHFLFGFLQRLFMQNKSLKWLRRGARKLPKKAIVLQSDATNGKMKPLKQDLCQSSHLQRCWCSYNHPESGRLGILRWSDWSCMIILQRLPLQVTMFPKMSTRVCLSILSCIVVYSPRIATKVCLYSAFPQMKVRNSGC